MHVYVDSPRTLKSRDPARSRWRGHRRLFLFFLLGCQKPKLASFNPSVATTLLSKNTPGSHEACHEVDIEVIEPAPPPAEEVPIGSTGTRATMELSDEDETPQSSLYGRRAASRGCITRAATVFYWRRMLRPGEIAGALGDLGTFLPDVVALGTNPLGPAVPVAAMVRSRRMAIFSYFAHSSTNGPHNLFSIARQVFFSGLWSVWAGLLFDIPMPIQPMHTVVAVCLTEGLTYAELVASGVLLGVALFLLGITGLIEVVQRCASHAQALSSSDLHRIPAVYSARYMRFPRRAYIVSTPIFITNLSSPYDDALLFSHRLLRSHAASRRRRRHIPLSVVRGLQLGLGLKTFGVGVRLIKRTGAWWTAAGNMDGYAIGLVAAIIALASYGQKRLPASLLLFGMGMVGVVLARPAVVAGGGPPFAPVPADLFEWSVWWNALYRAALPQLPVTLLNSVVATARLSEVRRVACRARPRRLDPSPLLYPPLSSPLATPLLSTPLLSTRLL